MSLSRRTLLASTAAAPLVTGLIGPGRAEAAKSDAPAHHDGLRVTQLGHSCLLVETGGARILIDPGAFTPGFEQLSDLDIVLVTHQHVDHLDTTRLPALLKANPKAQLVTEAQTAAALKTIGIAAKPLHAGDRIPLGRTKITAVGGTHATIYRGIPAIGNVGVVVSTKGAATLFHPGDAYAVAPEGVDVLAVPLTATWAKISETIDFVRAVRPAELFPIHDSQAKPLGRDLYLSNVGQFLPDSAELLDLSDGVAHDF